MFDESFVSEDTGGAVASITMTNTVLDEDNTQDGVVVKVSSIITVLWGESNGESSGATSDVIFEFLVVEDPDEAGQFQIKEQREENPLG